MLQYRFHTGSSLNVTNIPGFAQTNTGDLPTEEIRILVDTSVARTIILPYSNLFPTRNVKITVVDDTGAASGNNITIQASSGAPNDNINGSPTFIINGNWDTFRFELMDANDWATVNVGAGGGGGTPLTVNMTYAQLLTAIGANALIPGQKILLTDYHTVYYLQYSGPGGSGIGGEQVNTGSTEPLLLTAISSNEISLFAESPSNPQDLILYKVSVPDGNYEYVAASGRGCIIKRVDQQYNISRDYDWRTILFRRWETSPGSGLFYSYTPVASAAHIDQLCFPNGTASGVVMNTLVNSPLNSGLTDYWLDNTILNTSANGCYTLTLGFAFGNTFIISRACIASEIYLCLGNIFVIKTLSATIISNCNSNTVVASTSKINNNTIGSFTENVITGEINNNTISIIQENNLVDCRDNVGLEILQNNMPANNITDNLCTSISQNTCGGDITGNVAGSIDNNGSSVTGISNNVANGISANTNTGSIVNNTIGDSITGNSNTDNIQNNIAKIITGNSNGGIIDSNVSATIGLNNNDGTIAGNIVNVIFGNVTPVVDIVTNTGSNIASNGNHGNISQNTFNNIASNSNTGNITDNNVTIIASNGATVGRIGFNTGHNINSNTNTGAIENNNVNSIITNTIIGAITSNIGWQIANNAGVGAIRNNIVNNILGNDVAGIAENVGYYYYNNTLTGQILGNNVGYLYSNQESVASNSNIQFCNGSSFNQLILHGDIVRCSGNIEICGITAPIINHTFINYITLKTITPTAGMQAGTIPTSSVFQTNDSKFYEMVLTSGAFVFSVISN